MNMKLLRSKSAYTLLCRKIDLKLALDGTYNFLKFQSAGPLMERIILKYEEEIVMINLELRRRGEASKTF